MSPMISTFALHPAASKQLIAHAAARLPQVQKAYQHGKILIGHGTGNIAVFSALTGLAIDDLSPHVAGLISNGTPCATNPDQRESPWCIENGQLIQADWLEFLDSFSAGDIFIKGANAVDPEKNIGILVGNEYGGTIGKAYGILMARGIERIHPVGLEKLIPSCYEAQKAMGIFNTGPHIGMKLGYIVLSKSTVITEIESIRFLYGLDARMIAAGGVGGMEGSVMLAVESDNAEALEKMLCEIKEFNKTPLIKIKKKLCTECQSPCNYMK